MKGYCLGCVVSQTAFNTLVFVAISGRLTSLIATEGGLRGRLGSFFGKGSLPVISGTLLRSGQQYYLCVASDGASRKIFNAMLIEGLG